jgi:cobalt-zinc-cadmium efflux system outer membrane protein
VKAGDLARSDQHQAEGAVATASVALAEAQSNSDLSAQQVRALVGVPVVLHGAAEPVPTEAADPQHPTIRELVDRAEIARRARELAAVQRRAHPELTVGTTRERGGVGDAYTQTLNVGVRLPFGSDSRYRARTASAAAEEVEAETQLAIERDRIAAGIDAARARLGATRAQVVAAERRALLARETRGFFEKSFTFGETDLPTRLRIELEAFEAERQVARLRVDEASAVSQLRQALGLLPQ